jgi:hypothetical protein
MMLLGPKSIADIKNADIFSAFPTPDDMFQGMPEGFNCHTPFTFPGCLTHGDAPTSAPPFALVHPVYEQAFIDRYHIYSSKIVKVNLNSTTNYFKIKFKSDRHIIQDLQYDEEEDVPILGLYPWFRLIMFPIFYTGLARKLVFDLSNDNDEPDEPPQNIFQYDLQYDLYYTDS